MGGGYRAATVGDAIEYARQIVDGEIPSGTPARNACQRFLDDLEHGAERGLRFDESAAQHILDWFEFVPHVKGRLAGEPIELDGWQAFILVNLFGWKQQNRFGRWVRRYRTAYVEVARKNSKSTLSSGIGLYMAAADGEGGSEVYSCATTRDQARIVFGDAAQMVRRSPVLQRLFNTHKLNIHNTESGSKFEPLSSDARTLDGLNVHCGIVDELHAHKTRELWDVIETATGAREQPLLFAITTAGFDREGICYEVRGYGLKILSGLVEDDSFFCVVYTLDEGDDWKDDSNWIKANPHLGRSLQADDIRQQAKKAAETPTAKNNFLTKRLNIWCNASTAWLDVTHWERCNVPDEKAAGEITERCPLWVGVDLANKTDVAAAVAVYRIESGEVFVVPRFWFPEERLDAIGRFRANQFRVWAEAGHITLTQGNVIDHDRITEDLRSLVEGSDLREIAFDPWGAVQFARRMQDDGYPMVEVAQTVRNLSESMKTVEALILSGRLRHDNNPVMSWMMSNVVARVDNNDNVFPRKETAENKIDGPVALFSAINRLIANAPADTGYHSDPVPAFLME